MRLLDFMKKGIWSVKILFGNILVHVYFNFYWKWKERSRQTYLLGSLASTCMGAAFLGLEFYSAAISNGIFTAPATWGKPMVWSLFGFFMFSSLALIIYNQKERKHAIAENTAIGKIWLLFQNRKKAFEKSELVVFFLKEIVSKAFAKQKIIRVWLWVPDGDNLVIEDDSMFPPVDRSEPYVKTLKKGDGVAGSVFMDGMPRYVPRMRLPFNDSLLSKLSMRFLHSIKFNVNYQGDTGVLDLGEAGISRSHVKLLDDSIPSSLKSFLSVPVQLFGKQECIGVLCIDFEKSNPLGKDEIKMATVFGTLLAEEAANRRINLGVARFEAQTQAA
jgi:hypothetical protein